MPEITLDELLQEVKAKEEKMGESPDVTAKINLTGTNGTVWFCKDSDRLRCRRYLFRIHYAKDNSEHCSRHPCGSTVQ